jgi:hypothetical protein
MSILVEIWIAIVNKFVPFLFRFVFYNGFSISDANVPVFFATIISGSERPLEFARVFEFPELVFYNDRSSRVDILSGLLGREGQLRARVACCQSSLRVKQRTCITAARYACKSRGDIAPVISDVSLVFFLIFFFRVIRSHLHVRIEFNGPEFLIIRSFIVRPNPERFIISWEYTLNFLGDGSSRLASSIRL